MIKIFNSFFTICEIITKSTIRDHHFHQNCLYCTFIRIGLLVLLEICVSIHIFLRKQKSILTYLLLSPILVWWRRFHFITSRSIEQSLMTKHHLWMFFSVPKKAKKPCAPQYRCHGGLSPSKLKYETLKINSAVAFKPACTNVKPPLLKTFWRRFWCINMARCKFSLNGKHQ